MNLKQQVDGLLSALIAFAAILLTIYILVLIMYHFAPEKTDDTRTVDIDQFLIDTARDQ